MGCVYTTIGCSDSNYSTWVYTCTRKARSSYSVVCIISQDSLRWKEDNILLIN